MTSILLLAALLTFISSSSQISIECDYSTYTYEVLGNIYRCDIKNNPSIINPESAKGTSTYGAHRSGKYNNDVLSFHAVNKNLQYFPKSLEKSFKNLKSIHITNCKLTEIHQTDLQPFPNLIYLYLFGNEIKIIEPGLFDFNTNLEYISIGKNPILHIDVNVFDKLTKLRHLHLNAVNCYDKFVCTYGETQQLIRELRLKCKDSEFVEIEGKIENLEIEAGRLGYNEFNNKIIEIEREFSSSRFYSNSYLKSKFEALKFMNKSTTSSPKNLPSIVSQSCTNCCQIDEIHTLNLKIGNMSDILGTLKPFEDIVDSQLSGISSMVTDQSSQFNNIQAAHGNIENRLISFEVKTKEMFEDIKQNLASTRHKLAVNFDEKIKGIEKRLMKRFEEVLEEKLTQIIEEKLGSIIDARLGTE